MLIRRLISVSRLLYHMTTDVDVVRQDVALLKDAETERQFQDVLAWLSPLKFSSRHQALRDIREAGTRQWFLTSSAFQGWLQMPRTTLLCIGAPASGKTFLSSFVIDHILSLALPTLYIYCSYKEQPNQSATNLLGSLLQQLSHYSISLRSKILQLYSSHAKNTTKPSASELYSLLRACLEDFKTIYIIVDALDELSTDEGVRAEIMAWLVKLGTCSNMLATSRPVSMITEFLPEAKKLYIAAHEDDIRMYVSNRMKNDHSLARKLGEDNLLKEAILISVVRRSNGM